MHSYFKQFCNKITIGRTLANCILTRATRMAEKLDECYRGVRSVNNFQLVGSFGRWTACSNASDIDLVYFMPEQQFARFNNYSGNGQSALLQDVKRCIEKTYPNTELRGDGQVVIVSFSDNMRFEVVPAFLCQKQDYLYADTHNGGSWELSSPTASFEAFDEGDKLSQEKLRHLCRMARKWREQSGVNISGILLDTHVFNFLKGRDWGKVYNCNSAMYKEFAYYDLMSLDFFEYLANQPQISRLLNTPGNAETVEDAGGYATKALVAMQKAKQAVDIAGCGDTFNACNLWKEIYGPDFSEI